MDDLDLPEFPRTKHLVSWSKASDDDSFVDSSVLSEVLRSNVLIEEKVDGTNVGITIHNGCPLIRNRSKQLHLGERGRGTFQLSPLWNFCYDNLGQLIQLTENGKYIAYGEWLLVRHTIPYDSLPSYFLVYSLFDRKEEKFLPKIETIRRISESGFYSPHIRWGDPGSHHWSGPLLSEESLKLVLKCGSKYCHTPFVEQEGVVVYSLDGDFAGQWFKVVRPDFKPGLYLQQEGSPILNILVKEKDI